MSDRKSLAVIGDDLDALLDTRDGCDDPDVLAQIEVAIAAASLDLEKKVDGYAYALSKWKSEVERYEKEGDLLYAKARKYEKRIDWAEGLLFQFLKDHNQTEIDGECQGFKLVKNPPAVLITDEGIIPAKFMEIVPASTRIRKAEIAVALKAKVVVPGAELVQGERLKRK